MPTWSEFSFGTVDSLQSYMLVHINPPSAGNVSVNFDYEGETVYLFASDFVFKWLVNKYNAQMLVAQEVDIFNAGSSSATNGAVSANNLFEKICLWLKP